MSHPTRLLLPLLLGSTLLSTLSTHATAFVAVTWGDDAVHFLDHQLQPTSAFASGLGLPSGVATDGSRIWVGSFTSTDIIAFDYSGTEQFRWSLPPAFALVGLDYLPDGRLLAIDSATATLAFFDANTGSAAGSIPAISDSSEAIAVDGDQVWQLVDDSIYLTRLSDGSVVRTLPNAAKNEFFEGTALTKLDDSLVIGAESGNWFRVSLTDGSLLDSGNNGLQMFDLHTAGSRLVPDAGPGWAGWAVACAALAHLRPRLRSHSRPPRSPVGTTSPTPAASIHPL